MNVEALKPKPTPTRSSSFPEAPTDDLERRRELGQFFTSLPVAAFVWDMLEVIHGRRFPANTALIDPACGDGVFLRVAQQRGGLRAGFLFGTDIDETLVPGWKRDPLLRGANMCLANGLLDDSRNGIVEGNFNIVAGNPPFSGKGLRDLLKLLDEPSDERKLEEQDLFGGSLIAENTNPVRVQLSRRERMDLDRVLRVLSHYSCWRLIRAPEEDDETDTEIENATSELFTAAALHDGRRLTPGDYERAADCIARWPVDRPLNTSMPEVRDVTRRLASTAIEVIFTERFVRLAKPGGLIAVIVPEGIVASDRLGSFRLWLLGRVDLLASISLPQKVFSGVGANAKTTVLFARRRTRDWPNGWFSPKKPDDLPDEDAPIFLAAPRVDAPDWSIEKYLASVLADARRDRETFWGNRK